MKKTLLYVLTTLVFPMISHANDLPPCDDELINIIRNNEVSKLTEALDSGCDPNCVTPEGHSPVLLAAGLEGLDPKMTQILLQKGADPLFKMEDNTSTIHNPAFYANLNDEEEFKDICQKIYLIMLRSGSQGAGMLDEKDSFGTTPRQRNKRLAECVESKLRSIGRLQKHKQRKSRMRF